MPQLPMTLSTAFVSAFLDAADVAPSDRQALLQQSGIAPDALQDTAARVTEDQFVTLYRLLSTRLDDMLPNLLSHPLRNGAMKLAGLCLIEAQTLDVALHRYTRLQRLMVHDFEMHVVREPEHTILMVREPESGRRCKAMGIELNLKVVHGFLSWLAGREVPLVRIDIASPKPAYAAEFQRFFPGPVHFDQPGSRLVFDARQMSLRVLRNAADLRNFLSRLPRDWLFLRMKERLSAQQVRDYLMLHGMARTHVEQVARAMNVSVRTLCRRLEEEGTAFQQVKDEVRRDLAMERLAKSDVPIAAIAGELGFVDVSSFHRAFRSWAGMTPNAYRRARSTKPVIATTAGTQNAQAAKKTPRPDSAEDACTYRARSKR